jgi:hypothetical protein
MTASSTHIAEFAEQLINTGDLLSHLVDNLIDALVDGGTEHAEATTQILAMLAGTLQARFTSLPAADLIRATELITLAKQSVFDDLLRALALTAERN